MTSRIAEIRSGIGAGCLREVFVEIVAVVLLAFLRRMVDPTRVFLAKTAPTHRKHAFGSKTLLGGHAGTFNV